MLKPLKRILVLFLVLLFALSASIIQVNGETQSQTLFAHVETTTIAGDSYYLHKSSSADGPATSLNASAKTTGRKLMGRWVYPLAGIASIPSSTWTITYRAMKSASAKNVVAHGDIDIMIRKSDGAPRTIIATDVANSLSLSTTNSWETLTGTYDWPGYTVVNQTDHLEVAYYIEVTTPQNSKSVHLMVDDNTLAVADQTKVENVVFAYVNQAPIASFSYSPNDPVINEIVTFNASDSYDPDGSIANYTWNFGDGNITTVANPITTHTYSQANSTVTYTVTLTVTDNEGSTNSTTKDIPVTNPSILRVSLPAGTYSGANPDPWLNDGWILNISANSATFTLRINDTIASITSYDTHLIIALNNASYDNLISLSVNSTAILKSTFQYGTPKPYNIWNWPSGDVYPTWFADTYIIGTINPKDYKDLTVSASISNATDAKMHFDAYGSKDPVPPPPDVTGKITHNPLSSDSTVQFFPPPVVQYYLTVTSPYGTVGGQGWYVNGSIAYATLNTSLVAHGNGTRRVFIQWSGDASGTNYAQSDPILMDGNKTAIAIWATQYYLNVTSPYGVTNGSGWYNASSTAYASLDTDLFDHGNGTRRIFTNWSGDSSGTNYAQSDPITMDAPKTAIADWKTQYLATFDQTGLDNTANTTIVTINGAPKNFTELPYSDWFDDGSSVTYNYSDIVSSTLTGKRFKLDNVTGPTSPFSVTGPVTVTGNYKTQYEVYFDQTGVGTDFPGAVVTVDGTGYNVTDLPVYFWWDENSQHNFSFASPLVVNASKQYVWVSTSGLSTSQNDTLTITSSGSVTGNYSTKVKYQITFDQTGVGSDFNGTIVVVDGTSYNRTSLPVSFLWDAGSTHNFSFQSPLVVTPNAKRYVWNSTSGLSSLQSDSITVSTSGSIIGNYKTQYYLTLATNPSSVTTPSGEGWHYDGTHAPISTDEFVDIVPGASRYRFDGWTTQDMAEITNPTSPSTTVLMDKAKTVTANYVTQYYLTVISPYDTPGGEGWYDNSTTAFATLATGTVDHGNGTRRVFTNWSGDASGTNYASSDPIHMDGPKTAIAQWKTQFLLTIKTTGLPSAYPTKVFLDGLQVGTASDAFSYTRWFDSGTPTGTIGVDDIVSGASGTRYVFVEWVEDSSTNNPRASETMDSPKTFTALYKTQYFLTVNTDPTGLSPAPTPSSDWYDDSTNVVLTAPSESYLGSDKYDFTYWDVDGSKVTGNPIIVHMNGPHTATAHYVTPKPRPVGGFWEPANVTASTTDYTLTLMTLLTIAAVLIGTLKPLKKRSKKN